ncbi:hypothetical protein QGX11_gp040 [Pseudomonas phage PPSC2]|uniref:Uncharacterized protein n=1 Tax=Pseudomonas phage PPSC2 TaxID=2041350 RepID=A0A2R2YAV7_9CAUD|nr:hypothetical protein QGX11_gp040 [Pseudomonas phage PPSC2]ATN92803.1 hypothetical protein PPSC2_40 [Pseudomonas phage PPSC2]
MYGGINLNELLSCGDNNLVKEFFGDSSWRILPEDALPADKHVAEMKFSRMDTDMFPGHTVAHGHIYNDSRGIFLDGDRVRTSTVKQVVEVDGELYIETRNTMYKILNPEAVETPNV